MHGNHRKQIVRPFYTKQFIVRKGNFMHGPAMLHYRWPRKQRKKPLQADELVSEE